MAHYNLRDRVNGDDSMAHDSNNNDDIGEDSNDAGGSKRVKIIRPARGAEDGDTKDDEECLHVRGSYETLDEGTHVDCKAADNWHLLDVDGQSAVASSVSSLSSGELDDGTSGSKKKRTKQRRRSSSNGKMSPSLSNEASSRTALSRPNETNSEQLSPILIHLCTFAYSLLPLASTIAFITLISLLFTEYWLITVAYYTYLILDSKTCNKGGRRIDAFHKSKFWSYLAAYFPIELRYSNQFKLDPNENYILNYHPHGISAFGCVSAFATNGLNFTELFPGITARFMVHETSFLVPVMRETFSFRGDCSVNSKSFDYILSKKWKNKTETTKTGSTSTNAGAGNLLALCGGGLAEADLSDAECLRIVVATRKGFVKKALIHGANLIPCIAFGENSVFTKVNFRQGSLLERMESRFYKIFKFKHPIYYGRSLFTDKRPGCLPHKRPISVIMGDPIKVARVEQPSQEQIDELHATYMKELRSIYESNKDLCTKYDTKLELV